MSASPSVSDRIAEALVPVLQWFVECGGQVARHSLIRFHHHRAVSCGAVEIVDAQVHQLTSVGPWPFGELSALALSVELCREAMDSVGVDVALLQAPRPDFCEAAIARYPERFAACLTIDPNQNDLETFIAEFRQRPGML